MASPPKRWRRQEVVAGRGYGQRSGDLSLIATLLARERFDRTMKFDEALEAAVSALTPEQVSSAFRRYLDPAAIRATSRAATSRRQECCSSALLNSQR